jgi:hypothetical protein
MDQLAAVAIAAFTLPAARTIAIWIALAGSIIVHGLSDTPGSEWLVTRRGEPETTA